jgi:hypothetical protein
VSHGRAEWVSHGREESLITKQTTQDT